MKGRREEQLTGTLEVALAGRELGAAAVDKLVTAPASAKTKRGFRTAGCQGTKLPRDKRATHSVDHCMPAMV